MPCRPPARAIVAVPASAARCDCANSWSRCVSRWQSCRQDRRRIREPRRPVPSADDERQASRRMRVRPSRISRPTDDLSESLCCAPRGKPRRQPVCRSAGGFGAIRNASMGSANSLPEPGVGRRQELPVAAFAPGIPARRQRSACRCGISGSSAGGIGKSRSRFGRTQASSCPSAARTGPCQRRHTKSGMRR